MLFSLSIDCLLYVTDYLDGRNVFLLWSCGDSRLQQKLQGVKTLHFSAKRGPWTSFLLSRFGGLQNLVWKPQVFSADASLLEQLVSGLPTTLKVFKVNSRYARVSTLYTLLPRLPQVETLKISMNLPDPYQLSPLLRDIRLGTAPRQFQEFLDSVPLAESIKFAEGNYNFVGSLKWPPNLTKFWSGSLITASNSPSFAFPPTLVELRASLLSEETGLPELKSMESLLKLPLLTRLQLQCTGFSIPTSYANFPPLLKQMKLVFLPGYVIHPPEYGLLGDMKHIKATLPHIESILITHGRTISEFWLTDDNCRDFPLHWTTAHVKDTISSSDALKHLPLHLKELHLTAPSAPFLEGIVLPPNLTALAISRGDSVPFYISLSCTLPKSLKYLVLEGGVAKIQKGLLKEATPYLDCLLCSTESLSENGLLDLPRYLTRFRLDVFTTADTLDDVPFFQDEKHYSPSLLPLGLLWMSIRCETPSVKMYNWVRQIPAHLPLQELDVQCPLPNLDPLPLVQHRLKSLSSFCFNKVLSAKDHLIEDS